MDVAESPLPTQVFEPPVSEDAELFWAATRDQQFVLPWCGACDSPIWFPRAVCPHCLNGDLDWRESDGRGAVYALSVHHRPGPGRVKEDGSYVTALVDVDDGVRMMTNIVGVGAEEVEVGDRVILCWFPLSDGRNLPMFRVADDPVGECRGRYGYAIMTGRG